MDIQQRLFDDNFQKVVFDLPDADIVLYNSFFSEEEANKLFKSLQDSIQWQQDQITFYGKTYNVPRLSALYGYEGKSYSYSGIAMNPHAWTSNLLFIKKRIEMIAEVDFTSCLLNYYRDGNDSNNWHQDNEKELGKNPIIGSVSFGQTRPFQLKHIFKKGLKKVDIPLTHGSFLLMKGITQHFWKHNIPKTTKTINPRINLTFRIIKN
ncbi:alpha-ketoglutarate-dependent dioxygenase AlkB [Seonamhaeicola sediminis]|uniref:Alpha-ketoglutarate-dependent dioxygenase AlkB n=1 Tax=Seonamhaeicola sediminis TaxID=2528206 RepID=A0A562Y9Z3_9FLAO|nr:alpha-ketoglutarate-dependent dioxygenase AlkB [Seonamhaeicola sediminis]TWO30905.1 alpha-ketoglutarate-dependent dioxygenase AlkB [Seonamhaeicola sediminis]